MKLRIAILAACAGTLALAQTDLAQVNHAGAAEARSRVTNVDVGLNPAIVVATLVNTSHSNIRHPGLKKSATDKGKKRPGLTVRKSGTKLPATSGFGEESITRKNK